MNARNVLVASITIVVGLVSGTVQANPPTSLTDAKGLHKLHGDLAGVAAAAKERDLIPVTIIMRDQVPRDQLEAVKQIPRKSDRRRAVTGMLKELAGRTQQNLLADLQAGQRIGSVGAPLRPLWIHNVIAVSVTPAMLRSIAERDDVAYINHDRPLGTEVAPVEPPGEPPAQSAIECGVQVMQAPRVWDELGITGNGIVVCVIDFGCCIAHPDLENQIWVNQGEIPGNGIDDDGNGYIDDVNGWNFMKRNGNIDDDFAHGTHVAGIIAGDGTNGEQTGMAPDAKLMIARYLDSFAGESTVWESMQYATDNGAHVITASLGWPSSADPDRRTWREVCETTITAGVVVIYAAGNEGDGNPPLNVRTPGDVPAVITVGATDCDDHIADFSSRGPVTWENVDPWRDWPYPPGKIKPTVSAPGVDTLSTWNDCAGYGVLSGTSMATPHVSGTVALMLEANPNLDHYDVKQILMDTAIDLGPPGMDNDYGAGRVDAYGAVQAAISHRANIRWAYPDGRRARIDPNGGTRMRVEVLPGMEEAPQPGTGLLHYFEDGDWVDVPMETIENNVYDAVFPPVPCLDYLRYYLSAENTDGDVVSDPPTAPDDTYSARSVLAFVDVFSDDFEEDLGWTVVNENLVQGAWERGVPYGRPQRGAPEFCVGEAGQCWVTGNVLDEYVEGGPTRLISPAFDLADGIFAVEYFRWYRIRDGQPLSVEVSNDDGETWVLMEEWVEHLSWFGAKYDVGDFVTPSSAVRFRFSAENYSENSRIEAGLDSFRIIETLCGDGGCVRDPEWLCDGDVDGDAQVNPVDSGLVQGAFGSTDGQDLCNYDMDCDGQINPVDSGIVQSLFGMCDPPRETCP